ncbi:MAG: radical SAM protein [Clostridia bacterium]|nr:radical SAM protein [Clostridia bacterium]
MKTEPAKHILQSVKSSPEFFPRDYNMNLYRGCNHGCIYCDGRSACYRVSDFSAVRAKENALVILESELKQKKKPGIVGLGGMSDGYNPHEKTEELTRGALKLLLKYGYGIGITTKGALVERDIDLLSAIRENSVSHVTFSITCANDELSLFLEPGAPKTSLRFQAMEKLASSGIPTGVWINPVLPYLTDNSENILEIVRRTRDFGGKYALSYFELTLREGNREYFYEALTKGGTDLARKYASEYGNSYILPARNIHALRREFEAEAEKLNLLHTFPDVYEMLIKSGGMTQLSFLS